MSQGYAGEPGPVASRREVDQATTVRAQRGWWDLEAREYHADHGSFLGDAGFVWGPEGWTEAELNLLGTRAGDQVLEIGGGAGFADQFEAIEAAQEAFGHVEGLALVVQADPDEQTPEGT